MNSSVNEAREALRMHAEELATVRIEDLFDADPDRFESLCVHHDGILLDCTRNRWTAETLERLIRLVRASGLAEAREAMFQGEPVNITECRPALHTSLRHPYGGETGAAKLIVDARGRMLHFAEAVRSGEVAASDGKPFTHVVNLGIGGSGLGPEMALRAFAPWHDGPAVHALSNVDGGAVADTLARLIPNRTLVIVASKTFTTLETLTNAATIRSWLSDAVGETNVPMHFVATTAAPDRARAWGVGEERIFQFGEWVGGRTSLWSSVGLPVAIAVGSIEFRNFLSGGHQMDEHFRVAPLERNLPVALAMIGIWNREFLGYPALAILPYDQRLARFPAYLQQLFMESNGKSVTADGHPVRTPTAPLVWGEPGTEAQHSFFQFLHQGTDPVPCEFLVARSGNEPHFTRHHDILLANCLAQCEALMRGRSAEATREQLIEAGMAPEEARNMAFHKSFPGNRPSTLIAYRRLDPYTLGRLVALYEHRVFTEAVLWGINPFDQMGVELGKELADSLLPVVVGRSSASDSPGSISGTFRQFDRYLA